MSFNKIIIVGNLGKDPELRYTPQGKAVCDFSIATNERRRDKSGEVQETTTWFRVSLWEKRAELAAKYLKKGDPVYVEGQLGLEEWTDRDNIKRTSLEVRFAEFQFIGGAIRDGSSASGEADDRNENLAQFAAPAPRSTENVTDGSASADDKIPF